MFSLAMFYESLQDSSLWYADYFKLKTIKVQKAQEEPLTLPFIA